MFAAHVLFLHKGPATEDASIGKIAIFCNAKAQRVGSRLAVAGDLPGSFTRHRTLFWKRLFRFGKVAYDIPVRVPPTALSPQAECLLQPQLGLARVLSDRLSIATDGVLRIPRISRLKRVLIHIGSHCITLGPPRLKHSEKRSAQTTRIGSWRRLYHCAKRPSSSFIRCRYIKESVQVMVPELLRLIA